MMSTQRMGAQTVALRDPPSVLSYACVGGKFEKQGPLGSCFDLLDEDSFFGEKTWEKAESAMDCICHLEQYEDASVLPSFFY